MSKVSIIGAGNVAWVFGQRLKSKGYEIREVCSRSEKQGRALAQELQAEYLALNKKLDGHSDIYLLAINDGAIAECASLISSTKGLVVHFSGSTSLHAVSQPRRAVLWPLRSIAKSHQTDWSTMNIILESDSDLASVRAMDLVQDLGAKAVRMDESRRKQAHLIAVLLNNFSNHLLHMADVISAEQGLDPAIFQELMTSSFLNKGPAKNRQTGPAIRGDQGIIESQVKMLKDHPEFQLIYKSMSDSIIKTHNL
jgi:predicted short-subunit dehydrogenase-like oxidoreductase (DUF2520 family)